MKRICLPLLFVLLSLACSTGQAVQAVVAQASPVPATPSVSATPPASPTPQLEMVCAEHLNLRAAPGIQAAVVTVFASGQPVRLLGQRQSTSDGATWVQVQAAGQSGWLNLKHLCEKEPTR